MDNFFIKNKSKYVYIFADCVLTKGFTRTSLMDTSRKKLYFIPNSYYELSSAFRQDTIGTILENLADRESIVQFYKFLRFLFNEHLATLVQHIEEFPQADEYWDHPSPVTNAIIDVRNSFTHIKKSINELAALRCEYLQIRFFDTPPENILRSTATTIKGKCFKDVQVFIKFRKHRFFADLLLTISQHQKNIRFLVHSVPSDIKINEASHLHFTTQPINSCETCGIINQFSLHIPSLNGLMENKLYNSCLNRKIAVDEHGDIGNCPSIKKKYGNISVHSLNDVVRKPSFKKLWNINKDQIEICSDCEFRYMCSDCRAYTQNDRLYSKPAKCSYDPYTGMWQGEDDESGKKYLAV